ncbi:MAG: hypothetical protein SF029_01685 [bacterium]|nr:hypothetical protein [bacterium]
MSINGYRKGNYEDALSDFVQEETHRLLKDNALKHLDVADEWALLEDRRWDAFEYIVLILSMGLIEHILQGSTAEVWKRFADDIRAQNRERRQKAEQM